MTGLELGGRSDTPPQRDRTTVTVDVWYERVSRFAEDLYPGRYTRAYVKQLVELAHEVLHLAEIKQSVIVAQNYQYPELQ